MICDNCPNKKGMINKRNGVRIPWKDGYYSGKCTRPGGLCDQFKREYLEDNFPEEFKENEKNNNI